MYRALLSAVPLPPLPPPVGRTAAEEMPESGIPGEFDPGANRCAGSGGGGGGGGAMLAEGAFCDSSSGGKEGAQAGGAGCGDLPGAEGHGAWGSGKEEVVAAEAEAAATVCGASDSSWARPFDLVVVDMGSLGGLDFAQKLVRGMRYCFGFLSPPRKAETRCVRCRVSIVRFGPLNLVRQAAEVQSFASRNQSPRGRAARHDMRIPMRGLRCFWAQSDHSPLALTPPLIPYLRP